MAIAIDSRRKRQSTLDAKYPDALIIDVTSKGPEPWVRFSPFYPHGGIPIPNAAGACGETVEGIWQGPKLFEHEGVDPGKWRITTMKGIKRGGKKRGRVLDYAAARRSIYLPTYRWVLEHRLTDEVDRLRDHARQRSVVLLDYNTNHDIDDLRTPLSHAALVKCFVDGTWPGESSG